MRASFLVVAVLLSGCMSSSPATQSGRLDATQLRVQYADGAYEVVSALASRGCVVVGETRFDCQIEAPDGVYTAAVTLSGLAAPLRQAASQRLTPTQGADLSHYSAAASAAEQFAPGSGIATEHSVGSHDLGATRRRPLPIRQVWSVTRVLTADGEMVGLGRDDDAALRASLSDLLVHEMSVIRAEYSDHRMRR